MSPPLPRLGWWRAAAAPTARRLRDRLTLRLALDDVLDLVVRETADRHEEAACG
ncbi:hypothetical protein [Streptomyces europaeiscabiei]|uniref:hypothetical protein n=1 Tax=Streptomyces europaeiscabiei TaxID=146819 RepID=UPI002E2893A8|nr:hypothetical protein [Streptomyces europaeiscabiei]